MTTEQTSLIREKPKLYNFRYLVQTPMEIASRDNLDGAIDNSTKLTSNLSLADPENSNLSTESTYLRFGYE